MGQRRVIMTLQDRASPARRDPRALLNRPFVTFVILFSLGGAGWMPTLSFLSVFIRDELGGSMLTAAMVFLVIHGVTSTLGLTSGLWINRFGSKSTYTLGLAGMTVLLAALAWAPDFRLVMAVGPVTGLFIAYHWTGLQAYVIESSPQPLRGLASGIVSFAMVLAPGVAGPLLGGLAAGSGYRALGMTAMALVGSACVLSVLFLPNLRRRGYATRQNGLRLRAYAGLFRNRAVNWMLVVRAATSMSFGIFTILAGPKLVDLGGGLEAVGLFVAVGAIGGGGAQLVIGRLSDAIGRKALIAGALVLGALSAVLFGISDSLGLLLLAFTVQWFSQSAFQTLLVAVGGDIAPPGEMGRVMALQTSSFSWGLVVGVLVAGFLSPVSPALPFHVTAVLLLAAIVGAFKLSAQVEKASRLDARGQPDPVAAG